MDGPGRLYMKQGGGEGVVKEEKRKQEFKKSGQQKCEEVSLPWRDEGPGCKECVD